MLSLPNFLRTLATKLSDLTLTRRTLLTKTSELTLMSTYTTIMSFDITEDKLAAFSNAR